MRRRFLCAVVVAIVVAIGLAVTAYAESPDVIMGCGSLWPFC